MEVIHELESVDRSPINTQNLNGSWDLVYTNSQLFVGSPFFLFVRELFGDDSQRAEEVFKLHRAATSTGSIEGMKLDLYPD